MYFTLLNEEYGTGLCTSSCLSIQYPNKETSTCSNCHSTCLTCDGLLETDCLSCAGSELDVKYEDN